MEEEALPNTSNKNSTQKDASQTPKVDESDRIKQLDPADLTMRDIMKLEGDIESEEEAPEIQEESESESESEPEPESDVTPRRRLLKNKEARIIKKEEKAKKRLQRQKKQAKEMARLKKKVGDYIQTKADLGEIDAEGREVLVKDTQEDEEDLDFGFEDIEGLINNVDVEGNEEGARIAFQTMMMQEDHRDLQRILKGNYRTSKAVQNKIKKDTKLQERVS